VIYIYGKKRSTIAGIILSLLFPLLLTGCWSHRDLAEINIVAGMGLDRTEDGKILLTVQVVEPNAIQATSSGKGKGGGPQQKPVFVVSYEGETVFEALSGILSIVDKRLFLSTIQVLILGERLSQEGIEEVLDSIQRDNEIDYSMDVIVTKDVSPKEILEMESDMDAIPAVYVRETVANTDLRGTVKRTMFIDLIKDLGNKGKQPTLGQVSKIGDKDVRTEGTAVFKDGKLTGWLDRYETLGYLFAVGKVKGAIVNVTKDEGKITMEIIRSRGGVKVKFENGEPTVLSVKVDAEANVAGYEGKGRLDSTENMNVLKKILENEIEREIMSALEKTQKEYSSDIFGFGTYVRKYHPQYWKIAEKDWNELFSKLPVDIQVNAKIMRTGIIKCPINMGE